VLSSAGNASEPDRRQQICDHLYAGLGSDQCALRQGPIITHNSIFVGSGNADLSADKLQAEKGLLSRDGSASADASRHDRSSTPPHELQ
jgi:hypothetical protein